MFSAAGRFGVLGGFLLLFLACVAATDAASPASQDTASPLRAAPSRPAAGVAGGSGANRVAASRPLAPLPTTRIRGKDYVAADDMAARLASKATWEESKRQLTLVVGARQLVLTAEKREVS
ncbi:MAG: hypothetical protein RLZZ162_3639, partial [Verrucomicrobiota bacterium]